MMMDTSNPGGQSETERRPGRLQPNLHSNDPYAVLGLLRGANEREVKRAYFELVRAYPPEEKPDAFKLIRAAYEKLRSAEVKAETDLFLFQPPSAWEPRRRRGKLQLTFKKEDVWLLLQNHGDLGQTDHSADFRAVRL
jgi:curved DNA-binding protein CbpA